MTRPRFLHVLYCGMLMTLVPALHADPGTAGPTVADTPFHLPAQLFTLLPAMLLVLAVVVLLFALLRKAPQPMDSAEEDLKVPLDELKKAAQDAAARYFRLEGEHEKLKAAHSSLDRENRLLADELAEAQERLADSRRNPNPPDTRRDYYDDRPDLTLERDGLLEEAPAFGYEAPLASSVTPRFASPEPPTVSTPPSPTPAPVPQPATFGADPEQDYLQALRNPDLQAEFRRIHAPFGISCRNLSQRSIAGATLILERDPQVRALIAVAVPAGILIFPGFSIEAGSARGTLEGIYTYPADAASLTVATAARAEAQSGVFYLTRPGTFRNG